MAANTMKNWTAFLFYNAASVKGMRRTEKSSIQVLRATLTCIIPVKNGRVQLPLMYAS